MRMAVNDLAPVLLFRHVVGSSILVDDCQSDPRRLELASMFEWHVVVVCDEHNVLVESRQDLKPGRVVQASRAKLMR